PTREQDSNKGTFGKVLNICGSKNYIGAAYLSTVSSLKVGAGYSALASTKDVISSVSSLLPEAVYMERNDCLTKLNNYNAILIGCGLGVNSSSIGLFKTVLSKLQKETTPVVIDADGLNILSKTNTLLPQNTIITPHPLEASRLLKEGTTVADILNDTKTYAKELTKKYNCVTVLKTHRTVICDKNLDIHINNCGNSALAKAGSGDVLAGIITGLLAQKMSLFEAAKLGVYLHAKSGEIASKELTEYSVLASDLPKYLHKAIKEVI
ncbi:MAG: NAD(P)H-hydrate dehydratase, partial [bacterium]|nr:NAD(P)H-hydrate dehydratase [bacterium]